MVSGAVPIHLFIIRGESQVSNRVQCDRKMSLTLCVK